MRPLDLQFIEHGDDVRDAKGHRIRIGVVWLVAPPVTPMVDEDEPELIGGRSRAPARSGFGERARSDRGIRRGSRPARRLRRRPRRYMRTPSRAFVADAVRAPISITHSAMFGGIAGRVRARRSGQSQRSRPTSREGGLCPPVPGSYRRTPQPSWRRADSSGRAWGRFRERIVDDAVLLTSELVTNAVRHAGLDDQDAIEVTVSVDPRDPADHGGGSGDPVSNPEAVVRRRSDEGGWGLDLLRRLSSRWSVDRGGAGTDVWFEIDLPDGSGT